MFDNDDIRRTESGAEVDVDGLYEENARLRGEIGVTLLGINPVAVSKPARRRPVVRPSWGGRLDPQRETNSPDDVAQFQCGR